MPTPIQDLVAILTGGSAGYAPLGPARFVVVIVFDALLLASLALAVANLRRERAQRRPRLGWLWLTRLAVGCAWFNAMLYTLPFGPDNGLHGWLEATAARSPVPALARFTAESLLPRYEIANPLLFLLAFLIAGAFITGLLVRPFGAIAAALSALAWAGLYGQPGLWFWGFPILALASGLLAADAAGRAWGFDAWLRRTIPSVREKRGLGRLLRALT